MAECGNANIADESTIWYEIEIDQSRMRVQQAVGMPPIHLNSLNVQMSPILTNPFDATRKVAILMSRKLMGCHFASNIGKWNRLEALL